VAIVEHESSRRRGDLQLLSFLAVSPSELWGVCCGGGFCFFFEVLLGGRRGCRPLSWLRLGWGR